MSALDATAGAVEAIYNSKRKEDCAEGTFTLDLERGIVDKIWQDAWQTDTCIGNWHYKADITYKTPKIVIDMLVDIVSRNGNLLLNFPLPGSGQLDDRELGVLSAFTDWMAVNHEGIYDTRPWKVYRDGPSVLPAMERPERMGFYERGHKDLTPEDVRFTVKGNSLRFRHGMAPADCGCEAAGSEQHAAAWQDSQCGDAWPRQQVEMDPGRCGLACRYAAEEALRPRYYIESLSGLVDFSTRGGDCRSLR
jgi:alpha-L-fucosidase